MPTPVPSAQPTNQPSAPPTPLPTFGSGTIVNLAVQPGAEADQSSTCGGEASLAIDGNTDSNFWNGSVSKTCGDSAAWWWVDLGEGKQHSISTVSVYNRMENWNGQKSVWYSNVEILDENLNVVDSGYIDVDKNAVITFDFGGVEGRYVRVQKTTSGYLNIAEVEVMGSSSS